MEKEKCICGHEFEYDESDPYRGQGRIIARQDLGNVMSSIIYLINKAMKLASEIDLDEPFALKQRQYLNSQAHSAIIFNTRHISQCMNCGRLHIRDSEGNKHIYRPENEQHSHDILISRKCDNWKGYLRGRWVKQAQDQKIFWYGFVKWDTDQSQGDLRFSDWETLQNEYFRIFEDLRSNELIYSAFLIHDDDVTHRYVRKLDDSSNS